MRRPIIKPGGAIRQIDRRRDVGQLVCAEEEVEDLKDQFVC
jgi:hypothetical protein